MSRHNNFLDVLESDESAVDIGYDSEAAEVSKTAKRGVKRRKLSHSSSSTGDEERQIPKPGRQEQGPRSKDRVAVYQSKAAAAERVIYGQEEPEHSIGSTVDDRLSKTNKAKRDKTPGVVYLSSLPPYLKPSALRNLLAQRGFEPITRLFLTPASKHKHNSKKSSRQLYTEGWIEFANKKMARRCADALNAKLVGGKKGGFYYDDLWNMKYLKGMAWDELMAGIREERREEEGRRDEERRKIASETKTYIEGVERGKKLDGMKKKRKLKPGLDHEDEDVQRLWRQHEVSKERKHDPKSSLDPEVQHILSKVL